MFGNRGIYHDGWVACSHGRLPWHTRAAAATSTRPRGSFTRSSDDFSQANDLAAKHPEKVKELQAKFLEEAKKYDVLPLDDRMSERFDASLRPNPLAGLTSFSYGPGTTNISKSAVLNTHGVPFSVTAQIETSGAGSDGVLAAIGGVTSGWTLYVKNGKPTFDYNFFEVERYRTQSSEALPPGKSTVRVEFTPVEPGPAKPATVASSSSMASRRAKAGSRKQCPSAIASSHSMSGWTTCPPCRTHTSHLSRLKAALSRSRSRSSRRALRAGHCNSAAPACALRLRCRSAFASRMLDVTAVKSAASAARAACAPAVFNRCQIYGGKAP